MVNKDNKNIIIIFVVIIGIFLLLGLFGSGFRSYNMIGYNMMWGYNIIFWILAVLAAIWVIYDVIVYNTRLSDGMKLLWILLAIFFNIITAIVYYFIGRDGKNDLFVRKKKIFK